MKLFRYRPYSEFLFKELNYQELHFSSYKELNDPLDLSARIEFTPTQEMQLEYLLWVLFKTTLIIPENDIPETLKMNNQRLINFNKNETARLALRKNIYDKLIQLKSNQSYIWLDEIETVIISSAKDIGIDFQLNILNFKTELQRLTQKFLENSYTTSFSETNNDFLMWSHYSSKHAGICLEFTLEESGQFPFLVKGERMIDREKYSQRISRWQVDEMIYWEGLSKVYYKEEQPYINFFEFIPVFDNENDCDLIGLSKSWTHEYAYKLKRVFSTKTLSWKYENEWRAIKINFGEPQQPEERIKHYPIEVLTGIYFGIRTTEEAKKRIYSILRSYREQIAFYDCKLKNGRSITFQIREDDD